MAMLFRVFPPAERIRASAILTFPTTFAPALGPVLGGLLTTYLSWRWCFYVNVPLGAATVAFGAVFLKHTTQPSPGRFDLAGFLLAGAGLGLLMYGVSEGPNQGWSSPLVLFGVAAGAIFLAVMVVVELRKKDPIVGLRLLANRLFRSANGVMICGSIAFLGTLFVISLYFQDGRGLDALGSGLSTAPEAFGVMAGAQIATRILYPWLGPRRHIADLGGGTNQYGGDQFQLRRFDRAFQRDLVAGVRHGGDDRRLTLRRRHQAFELLMRAPGRMGDALRRGMRPRFTWHRQPSPQLHSAWRPHSLAYSAGRSCRPSRRPRPCRD